MSDAVGRGMDDWDRLAAVWQEPEPASTGPDGLVRRVRRRLVHDLLLQAANWAVGVAAFLAVLARMAADRSVPTFLWGFAVLSVTAWALERSWRRWRTLVAPLDATTAEYVAFLRERATTDRRDVVLAWTLYAAFAAASLTWFLARALSAGTSLELQDEAAFAIAWFGASGGTLWVWSHHVRRRTAAALAAAREFEQP